MQGKQNLAKAAENTLVVESMKRTSLNQIEELGEEEMVLVANKQNSKKRPA